MIRFASEDLFDVLKLVVAQPKGSMKALGRARHPYKLLVSKVVSRRSGRDVRSDEALEQNAPVSTPEQCRHRALRVGH